MTRPIEVDFQMLIPSELDIRMSMGHPTEIFEVTDDIVENYEKYAHIVGDLVPFADAVAGIELAAKPGVTDKVGITFDRSIPSNEAKTARDQEENGPPP